MLRESANATNRAVDLSAVVDPRREPGLDGGAELIGLADAALSRDPEAISRAAASVAANLGDAALVDAAGVIANFEMMNRIAEGTGIPVGRGSKRAEAELIRRLGLDRYDHRD